MKFIYLSRVLQVVSGFLLLFVLSACGGGDDSPSIEDTSLNDLVLSGGDLFGFDRFGNAALPFQSDAFSYQSNVGTLQASVKVKAASAAPNVRIEVNEMVVNSGEFSPAIALNEGDNSIIVKVSGTVSFSTYVLTIKRAAVTSIGQKALLKARNAGANDLFGQSLALLGDSLTIGTPFEDSASADAPDDNSKPSSGAAYVFARSGNVWVEQALLKASNAGTGDRFGSSVAMFGTTLVVGAPNEGGAGDSLTNAGAVYVFTRNGTVWTEQSLLRASNAGTDDQFGTSVSLVGDTLIVGAPGEASSVSGGVLDNSLPNAGAVYVFTRNGTVWTEQARLKSSNADAGDLFGGSVSLSADDTLAVGAWSEAGNFGGGVLDNSTANAGAVYVFTRSGTVWAEQVRLKASNAEADDQFGFGVSLSNGTLAISAPFEDSSGVGRGQDELSPNAGAVYVFVRNGILWEQQSILKASNAEKNDEFGISVSLLGRTLAVGAWGEDGSVTGGIIDNLAPNAGAAYVFIRGVDAWQERKLIKASNADTGDLFGVNVALFGEFLAVSSTMEDSRTNGADNLLLNAGAVYVSR